MSFWKKLFGGSPNTAPPSGQRPFEGASRRLVTIAPGIEKEIRELWKHAEGHLLLLQVKNGYMEGREHFFAKVSLVSATLKTKYPNLSDDEIGDLILKLMESEAKKFDK